MSLQLQIIWAHFYSNTSCPNTTSISKPREVSWNKIWPKCFWKLLNYLKCRPTYEEKLFTRFSIWRWSRILKFSLKWKSLSRDLQIIVMAYILAYKVLTSELSKGLKGQQTDWSLAMAHYNWIFVKRRIVKRLVKRELTCITFDSLILQQIKQNPI